MNPRTTWLPGRTAGWLLGLALLLTGLGAAAQQDPPGRVGRLNFHQGTVSFSPAGDDNWYQAEPNRPLTTGDRLWTDHNARAEIFIGSSAVRLDEQTAITLSELDDDTIRVTATQGDLQVRVRDELAGQRFEIGTANLAAVINAPGDYRINTDPSGDTTRVAVAAGNVTLFGENGESVPLDAHQQLTVTGRSLAQANGAAPPGAGDFDRWVAERDRIDDQSISARYVSREVPGYQQLDAYGDWQSDPTYGDVWYPRGMDAGWAPYQNGQWVEVAPWGWTWIDAAPWGFAPAHYGRWARIGPRWGWVPGRPHARPVYAPALVGFVGGAGSAPLAIGGGRHGVGWFPLAPGESWRPGYRASQRYIDAANSAAFHRRPPSPNAAFANRQMPGAVTVVPVDAFGRAPVGRRDVIAVPRDRVAGVPVGMGAPVPLRGGNGPGNRFGRPVAPPPAAIQAAQQQQFHQAMQMQQAQRQQAELQQRAAAQAVQAQAQQAQQVQQAQRQQVEAQQRAAAQAVQAQQQAQQRAAAQALQVQQAQRQQMEAQQRAAAAQAQAQAQAQAMQAQQAQQLQRQQQEAQQRAAQAQAMQAQQVQRQQQEAQQRAAAQAMQTQQLQQQRQQMEAQQRAAAQAMQAQQAQIQRQQIEAQQRAAHAQAQQMQQLQQQQQQQAAMRAQQQQAQQMLQAQQQQAVRQAQEARRRGMGRPGQDPGPPDRP